MLVFFSLLDLIDNHKSLHGDAPTARVQQRTAETSTLTRGRGSSSVRPVSSAMRLDAPHSCASWRKTYSLKNKNPEPSVVLSSGCSAVSGVRGQETSRPAMKDDAANVRGANTWKRNVVVLTKPKAAGAVTEPACEKEASVSSVASSQRLLPVARKCELEKKQKDVSGDAVTSISSQHLQAKASNIGKTSREAATPSTSASVAMPLSAPLVKSSKQPTSKQRHHVSAAFPRTSQFTWVKKRQGVGGAEEKPLSPSLVRAAAAATATLSATAATPVRKTPGRKSLRRRSPTVAAHKTSKYKWISSSARVSRKGASPKAATPPAEGGELLRKGKGASAASLKCRKDTAASRVPPSVSSRYCWQAAGRSGQQGAAAGGAAASRRRSTVWLRGGHAAATSSTLRSSHLISFAASSTSPASSASPGPFKLRSKMKIIRRSASR